MAQENKLKCIEWRFDFDTKHGLNEDDFEWLLDLARVARAAHRRQQYELPSELTELLNETEDFLPDRQEWH